MIYRNVVLTIITVLLGCVVYLQLELSSKVTVMTWRLEDIKLEVKFASDDLLKIRRGE
jgi:hypothetical protein